ncbi:MAG TPA: hypothetical protein VIC84_23805 [Blastocatellia bacterium]
MKKVARMRLITLPQGIRKAGHHARSRRRVINLLSLINEFCQPSDRVAVNPLRLTRL